MSTLVDAHAHFHENYSPAEFLQCASNNFKQANAQSVGVLSLCEISARDPLAAFRNGVQGWESSSPDAHSFVFEKPNESKLIVVAGRQVVTREKLELLALFTSDPIENGLSLSDTVEATLACEGVPVIPWGFGKWWFRRGGQLSEFLHSYAVSGKESSAVLLGDNGCRVNALRPRKLKTAESIGFYVTAGSDPLRLSDHVSRPGCFGTVLDECIDLGAPTVWLGDQFRRIDRSPATFGRCRSVIEFVCDQVKLRL